jgi:hypothetical protein
MWSRQEVVGHSSVTLGLGRMDMPSTGTAPFLRAPICAELAADIAFLGVPSNQNRFQSSSSSASTRKV